MDKYFFSEKNDIRQCDTLKRILNIKDNYKSKRKYKKVLVQNMQNVYTKYGKKKPTNVKATEFLDLLNKKSIKECVKICEENKKKKKQYNTNQIGDLQRDREQEVFGRRDVQVARRPQYP